MNASIRPIMIPSFFRAMQKSLRAKPIAAVIVWLCATGWVANGFAQVACNIIPSPETVQVDAGDTFQVILEIDIPPGGSVSVADIVMTFNPEVVNVTSLALHPATPLGVILLQETDNVAGSFQFTAFGFSAATTSFNHLIISMIALSESSTLLAHVTDDFPATQLAFAGEDVTGSLPPVLINVGAGAELDCLGVPNGDAATDQCGLCYAGGATNPAWNTTCADCLGVPNGDAEIDDCGLCYAGGASNPQWNTTCVDCSGNLNGGAEEDECGVCYQDGPAHPDWNTTCQDCLGVPNGDAETDQCGVCYAGGTTNPDWNTTCADCLGVPNGDAEIDNCDECYPGGPSHPEWNTTCLVTGLHAQDVANAVGYLHIWPNPAVDYAVIRLELFHSDFVTVELIDASGRVVKELFSAQLAGHQSHDISFEVSHLMSGLYMCRVLSATGSGLIGKLLVR